MMAHKEENAGVYWVDSYITSRNFAGRWTFLEKNKNFASKATYQKVALL